ncbi:hypothetical protein [Nocardia pseudobrasiliensis]|uniref:Uncharacterized protein n=1 Tax=Nocardia pseudobrasiliensis TaxID=45979 RepID=A0A370IBV6_9NOCA|nr:hypothetical protein [Nocardia pseudobrasiliensis]RDI68173.1 hypothetical protein DFR76_102574 [Nocardia pseudobrasiliensis]
MPRSRAAAEDAGGEPPEQSRDVQESPIAMSHEEIEEYRAKLRARYHEP